MMNEMNESIIKPLDLSRAERIYQEWPLWKQLMANQILRPTSETDCELIKQTLETDV